MLEGMPSNANCVDQYQVNISRLACCRRERFLFLALRAKGRVGGAHMQSDSTALAETLGL